MAFAKGSAASDTLGAPGKKSPPQLQRRDTAPWLNAIRPLVAKKEGAEAVEAIPIPEGEDEVDEDGIDKDKDILMAEA
eukprot:14928948-Alexandrium_andersonii.AAC.1